jgi:hypothetical protein
LLLLSWGHWLAADAGDAAPIGADAASIAGAGAGAGDGVATGAGAGAGASSFLPQAASATAATREAIRSDLFIIVPQWWVSDMAQKKADVRAHPFRIQPAIIGAT